MTLARDRALAFAHQNRSRFLDELKAFSAIPSISTDPAHKADMQRAAEFAAAQLTRLGMTDVAVHTTALHPVVFGQDLSAGASAPTMLVYGHYDVQPADPLELWHSDPFQPQERDGHLYARGASDMKGQVIAALKAVEAVKSAGPLPVNIKVLIEGEEEIGSPSLDAWLQTHMGMLSCDFALNPDAGMIAADLPTIVYGLRGLAYFELRVYGPGRDLHSGAYGGVVHNPAQAICELVAGMHDAEGKVTLPGYYDRVQPVSAEERDELARLPIDDAYYAKSSGVPALWGERDYSPMERVGARPTLEINGIQSGFTGQGSKTVIPAWAMAKISMRLVPNQDHTEVERQLRAYLQTHAPATIRWELSTLAGGPACITDRNSPATRALADALETAWGVRPVYKREGGSVPVVASMQNILGVDSVLTGFGLPEDNIHSPNERLNLDVWYRGIDALVHFIYNLNQ